jgi:phenylalanyl-tRNA synthetase beta chain
MVADHTGGEILEGAVDEVAIEIGPWKVELALDDVTRLLGPGFDGDGVKKILERLGMVVDGVNPMTVTVPTFRPDLTRPADLVEEVARIHGYDKFDATLPTGPAGGLTPQQTRHRDLHRALTGIGLSQAINLPFVSVEELRVLGLDTDSGELLTVKNPLREEESKLRPTILPGLLNDLRYNQSHGNASVALFESGKVFFSDPDPNEPRLPLQYDRLGWAVVGEVGIVTLEGASQIADGSVSLAIWHHLADLLDIDAELVPGSHPALHPGRTAEIHVGGGAIGYVGELAPAGARAFGIEGRVAIAEMDLDPLLESVPPRLMKTPSVFPHVDFDLSFLVTEETPARTLVEATSRAANGLVEQARVFDEFRGETVGEDEKALAIRYRLRAPDRTLEQKEIGTIRDDMIRAAEQIGARLRGAE